MFQPSELVTVVWAAAQLRFWPGEALMSACAAVLLDEDAAAAAADFPQLHAAHTKSPPPRSRPRPQPHHRSVLLWATAALCWQPPASTVAALLHSCLHHAATHPLQPHPHVPQRLSATLYSRGHTERPQQPQSATILPGADLAQLMWALRSLRYAPDRVALSKLLSACHTSLLATCYARTGGVPLAAPRSAAAHRLAGLLRAAGQAAALDVNELAMVVNSLCKLLIARCNRGGGGGTMLHHHKGLPVASVPPTQPPAPTSRSLQTSTVNAPRLPPALEAALVGALCAVTPRLTQLHPLRLLQLVCSCADLHVRLPPPFRHAAGACLAAAAPYLTLPQLTRLLPALSSMHQGLGFPAMSALRRRTLQLLAAVCAAADRGVAGEDRHVGAVTWPVGRSPQQVVRLVLALAWIRPCQPLKAVHADAVARLVAGVAPHVSARQLMRLLRALRQLRAHPRARVVRVLTVACGDIVAARRQALRCGARGEECWVAGAEAGWSHERREARCVARSRACELLRRVPKHVHAWLRLLRSEQRKVCFRRSRRV